MRMKRASAKVLSFVLALCMVIGILPTSGFAAQETSTDRTAANVDIIQSYSAQMREANTKTDYSTGGFTWDTEGKTDSWRYFNGVMLDAFLMEGDTAYADAFYNSNINDDGTIKNYKTGELDSVPTARGLFDLLDSNANAERYKKTIQYVYTQLEGQVSYDNCGGNYLHKQDTSGNPTGGWSTWNIGLDGLYMAEPFLMECANAIDNGKLSLTDQSGKAVASADIYKAVYDRFAWVAETMYDETTGLYNHGWNVSENKGNGHFWGRGIGWYAMALVDTIDMMPATYQTQMQPYLTKLFDGMLKYQDTDTGMWYNVVNCGTDLKKNILETSVSSMMAYSLMKAYIKGYVTDAKYGQAGLAAFNGVVANKVTGSKGSYAVKDTYLKSGVGTSDSYYTANGYTVDEAKGTGALIMAATQANAAAKKLNETNEPEQPTAPESVTDETTSVTVSGTTATAIQVADKSDDDTVKTALADKLESGFKAYDITLTGYVEGTEATVTMPAPAGADKVYYVAENGTLEEITGATFGDDTVAFTTTHFSTYAAGTGSRAADSGDTTDSVSASGTLPGSTTYALVTDGTIEDGAEYLIVNTASDGTGYALRNQNSNTADRQEVKISNSTATITSNEDGCVWKFTKSGDGYVISNGNRYIDLTHSSFVRTDSSVTTVTSRNDNIFWLNKGDYYLSYNNSAFSRSDSSKNTNRRNVYLFKKTVTDGASVALSVTPKSASLKPTETADLTASVLVNGAAADSYEITWSTSDSRVATVANGKVTAVADGNATITATLTSANGRTPTETVQVKISVTVTSKTVDSATLTGNDAVTTRKGVEPDFSNIKLNVTYDDKSTAVITTENGLVISGYDVNNIGVHYATITYQGKKYGTVKVTVEGNPYEGLEEAAEYPEYPADGAVRIDKTATGQNFNSTGVVQVELDTAGISVKQGVDVVLVVDVSNSMGWTDNWFEGMSEDEIKKAKDDVKIPKDSASETTDKLDQAMEAAQEFSSILLADNVKGASTNNSISFVTFAGYDADNSGDEKDKDAHPKLIDSVQTVFTDVQDANSANNAFANTKFTNYTVTGTSVAYDLQIGDTNGSVKASGRNRGNTNYDYAFAQANAAVNELKQKYTGGVQAYEASGRETVVVFMTDGAPSHYNNNRLNGSRKDYQYDTKTVYESVGAYNGDGEDSAGTWLEFITKPNTYAQTLNGNINDFYAVGFDLNHGGFGDFSWTQEELKPVLEGLAGENSVEVELAENGTALQEFYKSLATQIKYAGTNAQVTDTVDSNFTLQTTSFGTDTQTPSAITVTAYDLYTKAETSDNSLIGTRKGTSTTLETVTFNEDGTEAYSDKLSGNIMTTDDDGSVTITAQYFTYTKDTAGVEKFVWNIGDITDKEVALSYYAYLKGSMEGTCAKGVYYTNEGATLEYVDINGKYATKEFPKPAVAWGGASTSFEYYLVNYKGEPVNRAGQVVPFANRIVLYGDTVALNLNQDVTIPAQSINAADYLPEGYFLYDVNASYTVSTASSQELKKGITVSDPSEDAKKTTGEGSAQVTQTGEQTTIVVSPANPTEDETYIQSRVAFGVRWDLTPIILEYELVKDQIVMDYGKAIQTNVLGNDTTIPSGYTGTLAGFTAYNAKTNLKQAQQSAGSEEYTTANGTYTIVNGEVNFQLKGMLSQVEKVFCVVKVTKRDDVSNYYYLYEELDIIPATVMLYETDFADGVFTLTNGTDKKWSTKQDAVDTKDEVQNDGTIGVNQTYGFDSTYTDDEIYSNGTSLMVEGEKNSNKVVTTTASFDFTGTGFDLISRTGANQGMIQVKIFAGSATEPTKTVKVLNKSESELELYQIPVVSVNDLAYGTYHVTVEAYEKIDSYTGNMASLNRGGEFYFDAVRVFNPIDVSGNNLAGDAAVAQTAYTADGEANANAFEIRQKIIDQESYYNDGSGEVDDSVAFVDRTAEGVKVADYTTIGPNNEVYLSEGQGIAFKLTSTEVPASIDIGAKSADGKEVTLSAILFSADDNNESAVSISSDIKSCTAQNYDLMADAGEITMENIFSSSEVYVIVFNDDNNTEDQDGVLSLTDFKVAYGEQAGTVSISVTPEAVKAAAKAPAVDEPNYDILSASFDTATCKLRNNATMTVVTTDDVKSLQVTDYKNRKVSADITSATENGQKTWKVSIKMTLAGKQTYTVTGYSLNGTAGAPASATINVTRK